MDLNKLKREDVKVVSDDLSEILAQTIADYEARSGKTLQPAHIERLLINTYAYRETLARKAVNEAYRQQHPRFATGLMLDLCGATSIPHGLKPPPPVAPSVLRWLPDKAGPF